MGGGTLDPNNKYGLTQAGLDRITNFGLYGQATPPSYSSQNVSSPYIGANTGYPVNGFQQPASSPASSPGTFQVASPFGMTGGKGPQTQAGGYQSNPVGRGKGFQSGGAVKGINPERILEVASRVVKAGGGFIPHGDPQRDENLTAFLDPSQIHGIHVTTRRPGFREGGAPDDEGFDAYHGTPHTFPAERLVQHPDGTQEHIVGGPDQLPDVPEGAAVLKDYPLGRFRDEAIGTGEGAQAYGYGHYSAGHEGTAKAYRNALSGEPVTSEGYSPFYESPLKNNRVAQGLAKMSLQQALDKKLSGDAAIEDAVHDLNRNAAFSERKDIKQRYYDAANNLWSLRGKNWSINPGHMFHLRVNANPNHFLDWDKPLIRQHETIRRLAGFTPEFEAAHWNAERADNDNLYDALANGAEYKETRMPELPRSAMSPNATGESLYLRLQERMGSLDWNVGADLDARNRQRKLASERASEHLLRHGIPGIRYLDQNSRDEGEGTHNYVVFDPNKIDIKRRYARGGTVPQGGNMDIVNKALQLARMHGATPNPHAAAMNVLHRSAGGEDDAEPMPTQQEMYNKPSLLPPETWEKHQLATQSLADAFNKAISHHLSLTGADRIRNSKQMGDRVAAFLGHTKEGAIKPLLTQNAKLIKANAGYEAGPGYAAQAPIMLPEGVGVETTGLALRPAARKGKFKVCPNSAICEKPCLGETSGNYGAAYEPNWPKINGQNRTNAFLSDPEAFAVRLHDEINRAKSQAEMNGNKLAVRLNVLSDIHPKIHEAIIKAHPDVDFYDYTKMDYDPIAPNHHYTYSSTGLTQPEGMNGIEQGSGKGVSNPHQNWGRMRSRLDQGSNVAMVFNHRANIPLPKWVHDQETGKRYRVVDGTTHDYRPLDAQPKGSDGVIIGLSNLNGSGSSKDAHIDSGGFMVKYDPQLRRNVGKNGQPIAGFQRGPSLGFDKKGKPVKGEYVADNDTVHVAPQGKARPGQFVDRMY